MSASATACKVCPESHDIRRVKLVNGSHLDLCAYHRQTLDIIIAETPVTWDEVEAIR